MLTMFPYEPIERYADRNGWIIHRVERTISASKTNRRKQEEWMVCNYREQHQQTLFENLMGGGWNRSPLKAVSVPCGGLLTIIRVNP